MSSNAGNKYFFFTSLYKLTRVYCTPPSPPPKVPPIFSAVETECLKAVSVSFSPTPRCSRLFISPPQSLFPFLYHRLKIYKIIYPFTPDWHIQTDAFFFFTDKIYTRIPLKSAEETLKKLIEVFFFFFFLNRTSLNSGLVLFSVLFVLKSPDAGCGAVLFPNLLTQAAGKSGDDRLCLSIAAFNLTKEPIFRENDSEREKK